MDKGTEYDATLQTFYENTLQSSMGQLATASDLISTDTSQAISLVSSVSPENNAEENERTVYEIYLATWAQEMYALDTVEYNTLYNIAMQNPVSGGLAVYSAREMLHLMVDDSYSADSNSRLSFQTFSFHKSHSFKLYPNPASDNISCVIHLYDNEQGTLEIFNQMGEKMEERKVYSGNNLISIKLDNYSIGIYFINFISDKSYRQSAKFVIAK